MKKKRKIAIVLWIIQVVALFGSIVNGDIFKLNLINWIGYLFPSIIGVGLWFSKK
jgi:hypothetical protein